MATDLDVPRPQVPPPDHVEHSSGCSRDDVLTVVELLDVLSDRRSSDARVALDVHVVTQREDDALDLGGELSGRREHERLGVADGGVDRLEDRDRERRRLTRSRLSLRDHISTLGDGQDRSLLDGGRLLEG